jgi:hypothetical protein
MVAQSLLLKIVARTALRDAYNYNGEEVSDLRHDQALKYTKVIWKPDEFQCTI